MTSTSQPACLFCERDSHKVPLLVLEFRGIQYWICPEHLPILIHEPGKVGDKLPGHQIHKEQGSDQH